VFIYKFLNSNRTFDYFDKIGDYIQTNPNQLTKVVNHHYYISSVHKGIYKHIRNQYLSDSYDDGFSGICECTVISKTECLMYLCMWAQDLQ